MDEFTKNSLSEWVTINVYPEDSQPFIDWAIQQTEDDPTIVNIGWPSLFHTFSKYFHGGN